MRLKNLRVKVLSAATAADIETAVKAFVDASAAEKELVAAEFQFDGATYTVMLAYAE